MRTVREYERPIVLTRTDTSMSPSFPSVISNTIGRQHTWQSSMYCCSGDEQFISFDWVAALGHKRAVAMAIIFVSELRFRL